MLEKLGWDMVRLRKLWGDLWKLNRTKKLKEKNEKFVENYFSVLFVSDSHNFLN